MKFSEAERRSTINDVAKLANVSISTVSRVLNKTAPVAQSTVERVEDAITKLNFQPHPVARSLAGGKSQTLGILLPELSNPFFSLLTTGVEQGVRQAGFDLLIHLTNSVRQQRGKPIYPLNEHTVDGLIIYTRNLPSSEIERLYALDCPMVLLFRSEPQGMSIPTVTLDNVSGAKAGVTHLIRQSGCRRIAFLRELLDNEDSQQRETGYRQALEEHGIGADELLVQAFDRTHESCDPIIQAWLELPEPVDAIFADCDTLAIRVVEYLNKSSVKIPEDVAVVGFDDIMMARHLNPPLSTVRSPIVTAGERAVELLVQKIKNDAVGHAHLPVEFVVRHST